jgi:hypothetical protein
MSTQQQQLAIIIVVVLWRRGRLRVHDDDDVAPDDIEAAELVEERDAVRLSMWPEMKDPVVGSEGGPFCIGVVPRELIVFCGFDVHSDGWERTDVPCSWMVETDVGFLCIYIYKSDVSV